MDDGGFFFFMGKFFIYNIKVKEQTFVVNYTIRQTAKALKTHRYNDKPISWKAQQIPADPSSTWIYRAYIHDMFI